MRSIPPPLLLRFLIVSSCALLAATPLRAELAGVPEAPTPAPTPAGWLALHNDVFGDAVLNSDDFRTGGITVGARWRRIVLALDDSALTNRGQGTTPGSRTDELSYTAGYLLIDEQSPHRPFGGELIIGAGARTYGKLGGERAQNDIHGLLGYKPVRLAYDEEQTTSPIGYLAGRALWLPLRHLPRPLPPELGLELSSAVVRSMEGHQQTATTLALVTMGGEGFGWIGARYQGTNGRGRTATARIVDVHEEGWSIVAGAGREPGIYLSAGVDPQSLGIDGAIGVTIQPAGSRPNENQEPVNEELMLFPDTSGLGVQGRWQPASEADPLVLHQLLIDYRFGQVAGYSWQGDRIDMDQLLIGYEPVLANHAPWLRWLSCEEFVYGAGGARVERVRAIDPGARFSQTTAAAPVVQGGLGLRIGLDIGHDPRRWYNQLRFGVGYEGWLPLWRHHVTSATERGYFLRPGAGPELSMGFALLW